MLPFGVRFRPGIPAYEQVLYAVKRAIAIGQLRAGEPFPSVRALSQDLRVNPNTAHKIVAALVRDGLLEVRPGIGTVVATRPVASRQERKALLGDDLERLVLDAKTLGLGLDDVIGAVEAHWARLAKESR
jgi:GntR family transcriptional regulator